MKNLLIIFVKNPIKGRVKTRLAATLGDTKALWVYNRLLVHTQQITEQADCAIHVWYSDFEGKKDLWDKHQKSVQLDGDLGAKMSKAFENAFENGLDKVVIIGSDCLELETKHINKAFKQLLAYDVVIGPATDGGYYLLGMKRLHAELFNNIDWSTDQVLRQTLESISKKGLSHSLIETLRDIDTEEDLRESSPELYQEIIQN